MPAYERPYQGQRSYTIELRGEERDHPLVEVDDGVYIASDADIVLGDTVFIDTAAAALAEKLPADRLDAIVTPEAKALPLTHALAQQTGLSYLVARKSVKGYMQNPLTVTVDSITTDEEQQLVLNGTTATQVNNASVAIVDDVVSTGGTMDAMEHLLQEAGGDVVTKAAIFEESRHHEDVQTLGTLPIFRAE